MDNLSSLMEHHKKAFTDFVYFMLAAAGAAIAYTLNQTNDLKVEPILIPFAIAIFCWGVSFNCGIKLINTYRSHLISNIEMIRKGESFDSNRELYELLNNRMQKYGIAQSNFFFGGALSYGVWKFLVLWNSN